MKPVCHDYRFSFGINSASWSRRYSCLNCIATTEGSLQSLVSSELNLSGGGWEHDTDNLKHATDNFKRKSASSRRQAQDKQAASGCESGEHHGEGNVVREGRDIT